MKPSHVLGNIAEKSTPWCLFFIAFSIILHTRQYLFNRSLWFDETMNAFSIVGKSYSDLLGKLAYSQGIPSGFLFIEKFIVDTFNSSEYALRLFPFICGILSVVLFYKLIKNYLNSSIIIIAVLLFSISDSLIYYSSEVKPYSSDVCIAILILLVVFYFDSRRSRIAFITCAVTGALAVWISYPSVFVLSGAGITLIISYAYKRNFKKLFQFTSICAIWLSSFLALYHLSIKNQISTDLVQDWATNFTPFAPFPPLNASDFKWYMNAFFNVFTDPLSFKYKYLAGIIYLIGCIAVFFRNKKTFFLLTAPVLMTLIASGLERYPFSQRMLLFLIPFLLYFISEGVLWVYKRSVLVSILLAGIITFSPLNNTIQYLVTPRTHEEIKPLMMDIRDHWKEGDKIYIDTWITSLQFRYYQKQFGFNDNEYKVTGLYSFYMLPREENIWFLTSHRFKDEIDAISRYFELSGEKMYSRIAPKTYTKMGGHAAVFHYNLNKSKDKPYFLPGIGKWQGMYNDSWTNGNAFVEGINYSLNNSYRFLVLALKGYHPFKPEVDEIGLKVFINGESIHFSHKSENKYFYRIKPPLKIIKDIRIQSKTFVPEELNINTDRRKLGVNIDYIMLSNTEYFFYQWETYNGIIPGFPENTAVKFRWSQIRSSMSVSEFLNNNSEKELFLKCDHPDIEERPVNISLLADDEVIKEILLDNKQWQNISLKTVDLENKSTLTFQVSRTWSPESFGISDDSRDLGVAVAIPGSEHRQ